MVDALNSTWFVSHLFQRTLGFCQVRLAKHIMYLSLLGLLYLATAATTADETTDHATPVMDSHYDDGDHNVEFDHQAILGSRDLNKQFAELSPNEAKQRLDIMVKKMDLDGDGFVTKKELSDWVMKSFQKLDEEDARDKLAEQDSNQDGRVSWAEYLKAVYNFKPDDLIDMDQDKNKEVKKYAEMVKDDALKFNMADLSKDGILDLTEYYAFMHPWNYEHMHLIEIQNAFKDHDLNKDNFIDLKEYLGDEDRDEETELADSENFKAYDEDKDGKLSQAEVKNWVIPDYEAAANDEADHLIEHSDLDGDKKLMRQEILDKYELWVGSSATDYGRILHEEF